MKLISKLLTLIVALCFMGCQDDPTTFPTDEKYDVYIGSLSLSPSNEYMVLGLDNVKMLSLSNSLIDYNEQDLIFNQLAKAGGKNAVWERQTRLGKTLQYHFDEGDGMIGPGDPSAKYRVRSEAWTHIVLQEQSNKPRTDPEGFLASVEQWIEYIRENCPNPDVRIAVMMNWPYGNSNSWSKDMATLFEVYRMVAKKTGVSVYPSGSAFDIVYQTDGAAVKNSLYSDDRHPTLKASYLSACVFYNSVFNESPVGLSYVPDGITQEDATLMQTRAREAFKTYRNVCEYDQTMSFNYSLKAPNGDLLSAEDYPITWSVSGGGSIDDDGVFRSNGTPGTYTVTASTEVDNKSAKATITVRNPEARQDDEFTGIKLSDIYTQNFDAIGANATASLPEGWKIEKMVGATVQRAVGSYHLAGKATEYEGGTSLASNAANGLYNFGATSTATDRAIGGITTGATDKTQGINIYLRLKNTGSADIKAFDVAYDVEKYRKGNNTAGFTMQMYSSTDGRVWTAVGGFKTSFAADSETNGYAVAPGDMKSVSDILVQSIASGESLYLAWNISVTSGATSSGAQALSLDNVKITPRATAPVDYIEVGTTAYTQDFNGMGVSATAEMPFGWKIEKRLDAPRVVGSFSTSGNQTEQQGGKSMASNAKNGIYNYGAGDAATATDRAVGGLSTGVDGGTRCVNIYSKYRNTGAAVKAINIAYDVEKYRNGNNTEGFRIQLYYSKNGYDWTEAGADFKTLFTADANMNGVDPAPSVTRAVSATLPVSLKANEDIYLVWNYSVNAGTNCAGAMGLGIDNVTVGFSR